MLQTLPVLQITTFSELQTENDYAPAGTCDLTNVCPEFCELHNLALVDARTLQSCHKLKQKLPGTKARCNTSPNHIKGSLRSSTKSMSVQHSMFDTMLHRELHYARELAGCGVYGFSYVAIKRWQAIDAFSETMLEGMKNSLEKPFRHTRPHNTL